MTSETDPQQRQDKKSIGGVFDSLKFWDSLGPGWDVRVLRLEDGSRAYQYSQHLFRKGRYHSPITIHENGGKITDAIDHPE